MTDETAEKIRSILFKALIGHDITGVEITIEQIIKLERVDVLKEAIDRIEREVADPEGFDLLMSMLDDEEKK